MSILSAFWMYYSVNNSNDFVDAATVVVVEEGFIFETVDPFVQNDYEGTKVKTGIWISLFVTEFD